MISYCLLFNTDASYRDLNDFLTEKSGNWITPYYDDDETGFPPPLHCLPYCQTVPFSLTSFQPTEWNVAFRLDDYILNDNLEQSGWYKEGWTYGQEAWLDDKIGGQGSIDHKFVFRPNNDNYDTLSMEYRNLNAREKGEQSLPQYFKSQGFALEIGIKVPWNGNHSLVLYSGLDAHRFGPNNSYSAFLEPLALQNKKGDKREKEKPWFDKDTDITSRCVHKPKAAIGCHIRSIPPGKYKLLIVLNNITDSAWTEGIGFVAAY
ncbi:hypothetical protein RFI_17799 [Reticulomyxa filosa]|uniref:Uncharacterized protein n=1 Tax=Reticulomyxa filosa TaxID=46433 RepID=X6N064_RETFI|nr:hypothetical protein RFI_17799 [Reticulomyxa filosa]|eukprot:ETO19431.1 hypothetical protein RFI_17799 [Reticulomyxa filosa]